MKETFSLFSSVLELAGIQDYLKLGIDQTTAAGRGGGSGAVQQKTDSAGWAAALENVINGGDRHELDDCSEHREILSLTQWTGGRWSPRQRGREGSD